MCSCVSISAHSFDHKRHDGGVRCLLILLYTLSLCNDAYNFNSNIACIMNYVTNRNKEREIEDDGAMKKSCFYLKQDTSSECKFSE